MPNCRLFVMKFSRNWCSVTFLFFFVGLLSGQEIQKHRHLYQIGQKVGKLHELETEIKADPAAVLLFDEFNRNRKAQRVINYVSLGLVGSTIGITTILANNNSGDNYDALASFFTGIIVTPIVFLFGNGIAGGQKRVAKKRLLNHYKVNVGYQFRPIFQVVGHNDGIGLGIKF